MSQISPPIRIVVVAAIGILAAYMLFLRPKAEPVAAPAPAPATAPGAKGLSNAVDQAEGAASAQESRDAKVQEATGGESASVAAVQPGTTAAAGRSGAKVAAAAKGELPRPVLKAIADQKVFVLLFWNPKSADDRAVKRAVAKTDRWGGEVFVRRSNVKFVARYGKITRGAAVEQSPSVVVVDRNQRAETLVGYVDTRSVDQAVVDAFRSSGVLIKDKYLRSINSVCRSGGESIFSVPQPTQLGGEVETAMNRYQARSARLLSRFKAVPAPRRWRAFKRASVADLRTQVAAINGFAGRVGDGSSPQAIVAAANTYAPRLRSAGNRWNARMDRRHVLSCGSNF